MSGRERGMKTEGIDRDEEEEGAGNPEDGE